MSAAKWGYLRPRDFDGGAACGVERGRGAPAADGELEMLGAAEEGTDLAGANVRVRGDDAGDRAAGDAQRDRLRAGEGFECAPVDIRHEVAEAVDEQDDSAQVRLANVHRRKVELLVARHSSTERG